MIPQMKMLSLNYTVLFNEDFEEINDIYSIDFTLTISNNKPKFEREIGYLHFCDSKFYSIVFKSFLITIG